MDVYLDYLQIFVNKQPQDSGWIVVGFPRNSDQIPQLVAASLQPDRLMSFQPLYETASDEWKELSRTLEKVNVETHQLITGASDLYQVVKERADPFYFKPGMHHEETRQFVDLIVLVTELSENILLKFGPSKDYCPVLLKNNNILVKGRRANCMRYQVSEQVRCLLLIPQRTPTFS